MGLFPQCLTTIKNNTSIFCEYTTSFTTSRKAAAAAAAILLQIHTFSLVHALICQKYPPAYCQSQGGVVWSTRHWLWQVDSLLLECLCIWRNEMHHTTFHRCEAMADVERESVCATRNKISSAPELHHSVIIDFQSNKKKNWDVYFYRHTIRSSPPKS